MIMRGISGRTALAMAACLHSAPALADVGAPVGNEIAVPAFDAPVGGLPPTSLSLSVPVPYSMPQPAFPAVGAASLPPCDEPMGSCVEIAPVDWQLADLQAPHGAGLTSSISGDFTAPLLDRNYYQPVDDESEAGMYTVAGGGEDLSKSLPRRWTDHVPREYATHRGFFQQVGAIPLETALFFAYFGAQSGKKLFRPTTSFHFHTEGWFGKDTTNIGMDKLGHAFNTYIAAEFLHNQLHHKTNASEGDAITAAILASAMMAFNELSDGIEHDSGYSMEDIAMNTAGAVFSVIRNTVPGVKEKLAFKIEIMPNDNVYSYRGQAHYAQQRFMFSLKGAGFKELEKSPFRFLDLQLGYYASNFTSKDREAGLGPNRHVFVGVGLNVGELLFGRSKSRLGRIGHTVLDYLQLPYTSLRYDLGEDKFFTSPKP